MISSSLGIVFLALVGGIAPALIWLFFWLYEDQKKPEPTRRILQAFLVGCVAVIVAFFLERPLLAIMGPLTGSTVHFSLNLSAIIFVISQSKLILSWALIEETVKYLGAQITVLEKPEFDEPVDAMIYLITVALGFAAAENVLFLFETLSKGHSDVYFLLTGHLRFLGATVVHTVSSSIVGAAIALTYYRPFITKFWAVIIGLIGATLLHAFFNFFIINNDGAATAQVLLLLWLAAIFIIFLFERVKVITRSQMSK